MIFVFGSNLAGRHGMGAALFARREYGARYGVGEGRTGDAYAIPTKDAQLSTLSLDAVWDAFTRFLHYARSHPEETFLLTPIGCGLAGHSASDVAAMVKKADVPSNVVLSASWLEHLA